MIERIFGRLSTIFVVSDMQNTVVRTAVFENEPEVGVSKLISIWNSSLTED